MAAPLAPTAPAAAAPAVARFASVVATAVHKKALLDVPAPQPQLGNESPEVGVGVRVGV